MNIVIATEGGQSIGFGHIVRCQALYDAFRAKGLNPRFLIDGDESVKDFLVTKDHQIFHWKAEEAHFFSIAKDAVVIIDSYLAEDKFYNQVFSETKMPVFFDDYKRIDYKKGVVVNAAINAADLGYPKRCGVDYLLGREYACLRREFWNTPPRTINPSVKNVMITFGGDDSKNMTSVLLRFFKNQYQAFHKTVLIGKAFKNIEEISSLKDDSTELIFSPDALKMKSMMERSDLAISAGGQTLNELARMGLPTIGVCVADNQAHHLESWHKSGFVDSIGWYNDSAILEKLKESIQRMLSADERSLRSRKGQSMIDGLGPQRVCAHVLDRVKNSHG